jgi:hypothetical protein
MTMLPGVGTWRQVAGGCHVPKRMVSAGEGKLSDELRAGLPRLSQDKVLLMLRQGTGGTPAL